MVSFIRCRRHRHELCACTAQAEPHVGAEKVQARPHVPRHATPAAAARSGPRQLTTRCLPRQPPRSDRIAHVPSSVDSIPWPLQLLDAAAWRGGRVRLGPARPPYGACMSASAAGPAASEATNKDRACMVAAE